MDGSDNDQEAPSREKTRTLDWIERAAATVREYLILRGERRVEARPGESRPPLYRPPRWWALREALNKAWKR